MSTTLNADSDTGIASIALGVVAVMVNAYVIQKILSKNVIANAKLKYKLLFFQIVTILHLLLYCGFYFIFKDMIWFEIGTLFTAIILYTVNSLNLEILGLFKALDDRITEKKIWKARVGILILLIVCSGGLVVQMFYTEIPPFAALVSYAQLGMLVHILFTILYDSKIHLTLIAKPYI
ncbi:hypothetical protein HDV06_005340 [Boothiomyces sp. JEL0866]|nr:hypothetical protein HDV06_005340 [Boothiomyces sp. JEL0866]